MSLNNYRKKIDSLDKDILVLLGKRFSVCRDVANFKERENIDVMQPNRVREVIKRNVILGADQSLRSEFVENLYKMIIEEVCLMEDTEIARINKAKNRRN